MLSLVPQPTVMIMYHRGPLLKGNVAVNLLWYGNFSAIQRSILVDFVLSLNARETAHHPSVKTLWNATGEWGADVVVEEFCVSECGMHGHTLYKKVKYAYAWVGNPATQCLSQCPWPFHLLLYGPQTPPLVAPNGDVGIDGMVINLATVLAGAVTNPFGNGYYQGPAEGSLEAVSACTGIFGTGAFPGYPGKLLVDKTTGASYNAVGVNGRKYLLPAMWHPHLTKCTTLT
ncbi:hypothetical protein FH972_013657 [Carpinus fangiana]|uniref:Protein EXORDIUM-like 2 n=1 Tax=Carpinus fangiana TaxID=176857 RepID=A0A5N6RA02_9ROSI|nr:hypothetical protein FH972_013657 [Carpinus fangiana]